MRRLWSIHACASCTRQGAVVNRDGTAGVHWLPIEINSFSRQGVIIMWKSWSVAFAGRRTAMVLVGVVLSALAVAACSRAGPGAHGTPSSTGPAGHLPAVGSSPTASSSPTSATCQDWSTEPKTVPGAVGHATDQPVLTAIHTSQLDGYEQVELDFSTGFGDASVAVGQGPIHIDPSDQILPLRGNASMYVVIHDAVATWNAVNHEPYRGAMTVTPNLATVKQVSIAGDFEAVLSFGIGLDRMAGFRVSRLTGPDRLLIDVAECSA